ncbi:MAG: hypothetical protein ABI134_25850, partial [Byssovorax sp.]
AGGADGTGGASSVSGATGTGGASGAGAGNGGSLSSATGDPVGMTGGRPGSTIGRTTAGCSFHASGAVSPLGLHFALAALLATQVRRSRSPRPRT